MRPDDDAENSESNENDESNEAPQGVGNNPDAPATEVPGTNPPVEAPFAPSNPAPAPPRSREPEAPKPTLDMESAGGDRDVALARYKRATAAGVSPEGTPTGEPLTDEEAVQALGDVRLQISALRDDLPNLVQLPPSQLRAVDSRLSQIHASIHTVHAHIGARGSEEEDDEPAASRPRTTSRRKKS